MLNNQTTTQWITLLVFCSSPHGWKEFCCGQTSHLLRGLQALTFLLITASKFVTTLGKIGDKLTISGLPWCDPTYLNRITVLGDQEDVYTSVLFSKAFDVLLHNILIWKARHFKSGLPLSFTENFTNLGVQSSQETGKGKKKIFLSFVA